MESKCKNCGEPIPFDQPQVGGVHMRCEHEYFHKKNQLKVKIRPIGRGPWAVMDAPEFAQMLEDCEDGSGYEAVVTMMSKGEIEALPEFNGW